MSITIKRAYDPVSSQDGYRILVDRLWPRGIKKEDLALDAWLKELAPSDELRKWFKHDPDKWHEFVKRYVKELQDKKEILEKLKEFAQHHKITLIYAAKNTENNEAVVLKSLLSQA